MGEFWENMGIQRERRSQDAVAQPSIGDELTAGRLQRERAVVADKRIAGWGDEPLGGVFRLEADAEAGRRGAVAAPATERTHRETGEGPVGAGQAYLGPPVEHAADELRLPLVDEGQKRRAGPD